MAKNKELIANVHFYTAILETKTVIVLMEEEKIGEGKIEKITESSIKINGEYFMRSICKFIS